MNNQRELFESVFLPIHGTPIKEDNYLDDGSYWCKELDNAWEGWQKATKHADEIHHVKMIDVLAKNAGLVADAIKQNILIGSLYANQKKLINSNYFSLDILYAALDQLYTKGYDDSQKERDWDPRKSDEWQQLLDLLQLECHTTVLSEMERFDKDIQRYRHLRSKDLDTISNGRGVFAGIVPDNLVINGADLDQAIDNEIYLLQRAVRDAERLLRKTDNISDRGGTGYEREMLGQNNEGDIIGE